MDYTEHVIEQACELISDSMYIESAYIINLLSYEN